MLFYDLFDRVVKEAYNDGTEYYYVSTNTSSVKDGSVATMTITPLNKTLSFSYDSLLQLTVPMPGVYVRDYTYRGLSSTRSTNQVETVDYTQNGNTYFSRLYYDYTYDSAGNITQIKQNNSQIAAYEYDEQGQLSKQGVKMYQLGKKMVNIGRGISSVTGTFSTWGIAYKYTK